MESNSNYKENSNNIFDIFQNENNSKSHEGDLSKSEQIYGDKKIFPAITEILKKNFLFLAKNIKIKLILFLILFLEK